MKKKLFLILTIMVVSLFALSLSKVSASEMTYSGSSGFELNQDALAEGYVVGTSIYAGRLDVSFGEGLAITEANNKINVKMYTENIYRYNIYFHTDDGSSQCVKWFAGREDKTDGRIVKYMENGMYEYHGDLSEASETAPNLVGKTLTKIQFEYYTDNDNGVIELLGLAFDADGTFNEFRGRYGVEDTPVTPDPETPVTPEPSGELVVSDLTTEAEATIVKGEDGTQTVTYSVTPEWNTFVAHVTNYDSSLTELVINFTPSVGTYICFEINGVINWDLGHKLYAGETLHTHKVDLTEANLPAEFDIAMYIDAEQVVEAEKSIVFHSIEFKGAEQGGTDEPVEPDDGTLKINGIISDASATITTPEDGWQLVSYETSPGYALFTINVKNYDANGEAQIFEIKFTPSEAATICFAIGDPEAGIDWSLGHASYAGGRTSKYSVDLSNYTLESNFNIYMYIDAATEVTAAKSILFNSVEIKAPVAEPEGMYLTEPEGHSLSVSGDATEGWYVSYNNDAASWRYVLVEVKNHEVEYDIVRIKVDLAAGTNLGIRLYWTDAEGATVYTDLRDHWASSGVAKESKTYDLVYLLSSYNASGYVLSKMELYFDPATEFTTNTGDVEALIHSVELLKSSDYTFGELEFTASDLTVDYNGEAVNLNVNCEQNVEFLFEHAVPVTEGELKWNKGLPVNAGSYIVRVKFMGSLEYAYKEVEVYVTINQVKATVNADDVTVDAETRVVTVKNGVIASTDADFTEGYEVVNGDTVPYGTVIYYKHPGNENMTESDVLTLTVERPVEPQPEPTPDPDPQPEPTPEAPANNGCGGSVVASILGVLTLAGACIVLRKKREE